MNKTPNLQTELAALFIAHDLTPEKRSDWWLLDGLYPAIRARKASLALTIDIALTEELRVSETWPAKDGVSLFRDGVFPVLLSAFWQSHNPGQVTRQIIKRDDGPWQVFTGPYLRQIETGERPPVPYLLFDTIEAFLKVAGLEGEIHWLSIGVTVDTDGAYADIRLDGQRQPEPEAAVRALDWIYDGRDYKLRNSVLFLRV